MSGDNRSFVSRRGRIQAGLMLAACLVGSGSASVAAEGRRHAALVLDANTGRVISESAADEARYPASLTKMMTLYVVFELINQKKLTYDTPIVFSETATRVQPSKLGLQAGSSITVLDAMKALIVKSANDVAVAVAEHVAGSESKFAALMTQTARRIGMKSTTFKNAHGLPNDEQMTTARDMVTLGLRLQDDFPQHYKLFSAREFSHGAATHRTHNTLLLTYEGTDGIKTGYIGASGFNLVANVRRGDKHVIGVVFGGATAGARNQTMKTLLNMALFKASPVKTRQPAAIARAKPLPTPTVAARPHHTPATTVITTPATVVAVVAPPPPPPAPTTAASAPAPDIQVARVRPTLIVPRASAQAATLQASLPPGPVQAPAQQLPAPLQKSEAATQPSLLVNSAAARSARPAPVAAPIQPPGASRLNGPSAAPPANGVHLQVGAYASKADAEKQLASVRQQGGPAVSALTGEALAANANGKPVFRARFVGVDPAQAGNICNDLRRRQIDCMVARPE